MKICCIVVLTLGIAIPAQSQDLAKDAPPAKLIISDRAIAAALGVHPPVQPARRRDSVVNGALIGGILAGLVMAGGGAYLCNELKEPGETSSCWPAVITVGAVSFGVGAAIGAGIDLLITRSPARPFDRAAFPRR